jgi:hypothetical protein
MALLRVQVFQMVVGFQMTLHQELYPDLLVVLPALPDQREVPLPEIFSVWAFRMVYPVVFSLA